MSLNSLIGQTSPGQFGAIGDPGTLTVPGGIVFTGTLLYYPGVSHPVVFPIEDGTNHVSVVFRSSWNLLYSISIDKSISWDITGVGVTVTDASSWNIYQRIEFISAFSTSGIVRPVVFPVDSDEYIPSVRWNSESRFSVIKKTSWKIFARDSIQKKFQWNIRISAIVQRNLSWKVLKRIYVPGVSIEEFLQLDLPVVHPISFHAYSPSPAITWNINYRIKLQKRTTWNLLFRTSIKVKTAWNTLCNIITKIGASAWNTTAFVIIRKASAWALQSRISLKKPVKWNLKFAIAIDKSIAWKIHNNIVKTIASAWNINRRLLVNKRSSWNLLERNALKKNFSWVVLKKVVVYNWTLTSNSPGNISSAIVHPIDIRTPGLQPYPYQGLSTLVVSPIDYNNYRGYGYSSGPGITWRLGINPNGPVVVRDASAWNILNRVTIRKHSSWNMVGRSDISYKVLYNVLNSVSLRASFSWNTGSPLQGQIRQTVIDRTDFAY